MICLTDICPTGYLNTLLVMRGVNQRDIVGSTFYHLHFQAEQSGLHP